VIIDVELREILESCRLSVPLREYDVVNSVVTVWRVGYHDGTPVFEAVTS
jgi:hypothetical protein